MVRGAMIHWHKVLQPFLIRNFFLLESCPSGNVIGRHPKCKANY